MKKYLLITLLLLTACVLAPTPVVTSTLPATDTPTPTATPIPPTATITSTPTPSFPPEIAAKLPDSYQIVNNQAIVNGVPLYSLDAQTGEWVPAQFVVDFDSYQFSLDGLEIASENGVVRIIDPNATDEKDRLVYENGKFGLRFVVENLSDLMPTPYKPDDDSPYGAKLPPWEVMTTYTPSIFSKIKTAFQEKYNLEINGMIIITTQEDFISWNILLDPEIYAYGLIMKRNKFDQNSDVWLVAEKADGSIIIIPLSNEISRNDIYRFWNEQEK